MRVMWFTNVWNLLFPPTEVLPGPDPLRASDDGRVERALRELARIDGWAWKDFTASLEFAKNKNLIERLLAAADGEVKP